MTGKRRNTEPPTWWLFLGLTLVLGGLVLLLIPANLLGF